MICNRQTLLAMRPMYPMAPTKHHEHGVSHGLSEAGYDLRIKQEVIFRPHPLHIGHMANDVRDGRKTVTKFGRFCLASAIEEFTMPNNLTGIVHDKSTWARKGLSVFNTVIEPGWNGFLTLELVYHGQDELIIPAGAGIAQVVFHFNSDAAEYDGRYQNQADEPVAAKSSA